MSRKGTLILVLLFGLAFALLAFATRGYREVESMQSLEKAMAAVRRDFPGAEPISPAELALWLEDPAGILLIDARTPEEFAVSRLPGAQRESSVKGAAERIRGASRVLVYDAVGFFSAELTEDLKPSAPEEIRYLEGGIFRWANEGRPLVDAGGGPTTKVHPYNKLWGRLLEKRGP